MNKKIRKGSIVVVKVIHSWTIEITKILKGRIVGTIVNSGAVCDFTPDKIVEVKNY